ncbi:MAG: hypothetical protein LUQ25_07735 [Methanoregulaceae archaeon]|nr:hypothetical protein [Methanoregulaceae archaeon]
MSEYAEGTVNKPFWKEMPDVAGYVGRKLPTLDRSLDSYLDRNFEAIIEEWGLLREDDIIELERRLDRITEDVTRLSTGKTALADRAERLAIMISGLEEVAGR